MVDDEPLVALDIAQCLQSEGASVQTAHCLADGLRLAEHHDLSAAVLDTASVMVRAPYSASA